MLPSKESPFACAPELQPERVPLRTTFQFPLLPSLTSQRFFRVSRWLGIVIAVALLLGFADSKQLFAQASPGCAAGTCVSGGPRLLGLNTGDSEILDGLVGSLLGSEVDISLANWQALAAADVTLGELQTALGVATPEALLADPITLNELLTALSNVPGLTELQAIDLLLAEIAALPNATQEIILGDLLDIQSGADPFTTINLNVLDVVFGSIELFNSQNVATTPTPITIDGSALGLDEIGEITIQTRVLEPPVIACGPTGTQFYSSGLRVKLGIEVLNLMADGSPLGLADVDVALIVSDLDLYLDIAPGSGIVQAINAINRTVTVQATPGIADVYVGTIADNVFFSSTPIDPASLTPGVVASLVVTLPVPLNPSVVLTAAVAIETFAEANTGPKTLNFTGSPAGSGNYPQTLAASAGANAITSLVTQLISNLVVDANLATNLTSQFQGLGATLTAILGALGIDVNSLTTQVVDFAEDTLLPDLLEPLLTEVMTEIADPLLAGLGVGLGEMDVTVLGITELCPALTISKSHTGNFAAGGTGLYTIVVTNTGSYTAQSPITVVDVLPTGLSYASHTPAGWVRQGATNTFINNTLLGPGQVLPALQLTVSVAADAPGVVFNNVSANTVGNTGGGASSDSDRTVITGSNDADGDGTPSNTDPDDNAPCVPSNQASTCDRDGDGLTNGEEAAIGTNPDDPDTDDDGPGLNDGQEVNNNPPSDPLNPCDPNPNATACNPGATDTDGDLVPDSSDPAPNNPCVPNPNAALCDVDNDGLDNSEEQQQSTNPNDADTDDDGINDGTEVTNGTNPLDPCSPNNQAGACDKDNDGLTNAEEEAASTDPNNPDTDGDGVVDGADPAPLSPCVPNANAAACPTGNPDFEFNLYAPKIETQLREPPTPTQ